MCLLIRGVLNYQSIMKLPDIPYGDHYTQHETWTVISSSDTATKCILRGAGSMAFTKPTVFESKITERSKDEMVKNFKLWCTVMKERGFMEKIEIPIKIAQRKDMQNRGYARQGRTLRS